MTALPPSRSANRGKRPRGRGRGGSFTSGPRLQSTIAGDQTPALSSQADTPVLSDSESTSGPAPTVSTYLSSVRFDSLRDRVDARLLKAIPFEYMSEVQAATLEPALSGVDVLAQAKTGTGKTVAFLVPSINRLLNSANGAGPGAGKGKVGVLALSPTRELALQIEKEAKLLLSGLGGIVGVQHVVGGTNMSSEQKKLASERCDLLIATPGRLLDHLANTPGMAARFSNIQTVILDEADRMLDMGFRKDLEKINTFLPSRSTSPRQALLFSATIPPGVRDVADLSPDAAYINTLSEEESNTHQHIPQQSVVAPATDLLPLTLALVMEEIERHAGKAKLIVFSPTARAAALAAEVFRTPAVEKALAAKTTLPMSVGEIHSRKSQSQRVKATETFARASCAVLFSSDVAARGVDFPGVTAVLQVGLPASAEQYIHRIGRTGRAGAVGGRGVIILADYEKYFLAKGEMRDLPLAPHPGLDESLSESRDTIAQALHAVDDDVKTQAYQAALGYYKGELKSLRWSAAVLVEKLNEYARDALLFAGGDPTARAPPLLAKTVGKMGLKGVPGLNIVRELPERGGASGGGSGQRGRGGYAGGDAGRGKRAKPDDASGTSTPMGGAGRYDNAGEGGYQGQGQRGGRGRGGFGGAGGGGGGGFGGGGGGRGGFGQRGGRGGGGGGAGGGGRGGGQGGGRGRGSFGVRQSAPQASNSGAPPASNDAFGGW